MQNRYEEDLVDQLFNSSEKRLARVLLFACRFGKEGIPETVVPKISQESFSEMVGTTRSRVSFFMNRFRKLGFIHYAGAQKALSRSIAHCLMSFSTTKFAAKEKRHPPKLRMPSSHENASSISGIAGNSPAGRPRPSAVLEVNLISVCIGQRVFDTEFLVQVVVKSALIGFGRNTGFDDLLHCSIQSGARIFSILALNIL